MGLSKKTFLYSIAIAAIMTAFIIGYFVLMLPSLYVDYVCEQNLRSVLAQHRAYMECGTYEAVRVRNPTACFSVEIPVSGDYVLLTGKSWTDAGRDFSRPGMPGRRTRRSCGRSWGRTWRSWGRSWRRPGRGETCLWVSGCAIRGTSRMNFPMNP